MSHVDYVELHEISYMEFVFQLRWKKMLWNEFEYNVHSILEKLKGHTTNMQELIMRNNTYAIYIYSDWAR